jgi:hypothetical protein
VADLEEEEAKVVAATEVEGIMDEEVEAVVATPEVVDAVMLAIITNRMN